MHTKAEGEDGLQQTEGFHEDRVARHDGCLSPDVKRFPAPDGTPTPQIRLLLAPGQSNRSLHGSTDRSEGPHVVVRLSERLRH